MSASREQQQRARHRPEPSATPYRRRIRRPDARAYWRSRHHDNGCGDTRRLSINGTPLTISTAAGREVIPPRWSTPREFSDARVAATYASWPARWNPRTTIGALTRRRRSHRRPPSPRQASGLASREGMPSSISRRHGQGLLVRLYVHDGPHVLNHVLLKLRVVRRLIWRARFAAKLPARTWNRRAPADHQWAGDVIPTGGQLNSGQRVFLSS